MNQLTTIASLPSGGGCMSALPAERMELKPAPPAEVQVATPSDPSTMSIEELADRYLAACLGKEAPADRQGFEPFEYTERS